MPSTDSTPGFVSVRLTPSGRPQSILSAPPSPPLADGESVAAAPPASGASPAPGEHVVVETGQGTALGQVTPTIPQIADRRRPPEDTPRFVLRLATREDIATRLRHQQREREAHQYCGMKIRELGLMMKLTKVEQTFDGSRIIFYYTAEERVDFRELVRELAAHFRVRIEMRQIGVRDEARILGGYGPCGQPLCCTSWLATFEPVTIKMAKQQNLSLNPSRLSGMCGRLKCCLRYEITDGHSVKHGGSADSTGSQGEHGCERGLVPPKHVGGRWCEGGPPPKHRSEEGCEGGRWCDRGLVPPKHRIEDGCEGGCCRG